MEFFANLKIYHIIIEFMCKFARYPGSVETNSGDGWASNNGGDV